MKQVSTESPQPQRQFNTTLRGIPLALALILTHNPAAATTIDVTTSNPAIDNSDGACSLIEAIENANADAQAHTDCEDGSGADTLVLEASTHSITTPYNSSSNGLPVITSTITIQGNDATIERAADASDDFRLFQITPQGNLTLEQTTVSGGAASSGGGISNLGTTTLINSSILGNSTVSGNSGSSKGGGIINHGTLTLTNSTVSGNSGSGNGGGIANYDTLTLTNSTISGNSTIGYGGGIANYGTLTLANSAVSGNSAGHGGGINNYGTLTLANSAVSGNSAIGNGGGISNYSLVTLTDSTVSNNMSDLSGGGIHQMAGTATMNRSTLSGNSANGNGGGIFSNGGVTNITNSTLSGNSASRGGGSFSYSGTADISNSTISNNTATTSGGGLVNTIFLKESIVSGNVAPTDAEITGIPSVVNNAPGFNVLGHDGLTLAAAGINPFLLIAGDNIIATSDGNGNTPTPLSDILNITLADNGGATQTHALVSDSPAIDHIPAASCSTTEDQRGSLRPVDGGTGTADCDSGAFEFGTANNICGITYSLPNNEWHQISLPCDPGENHTTANIFGDDNLGVYGTDWALWAYNPTDTDTAAANTYINVGIDGTVEQGMGYWIIQKSGTEQTLDMPAGSSPTPTTTCPGISGNCFQIPLATQSGVATWNMIGFPFATAKSLGDTRVLISNFSFSIDSIITRAASVNSCLSDGTCTLDTAESEAIVHNKVWNYDGSNYTMVDTSGDLNPWMGYWLPTLSDADGVAPVHLLIPE